MRSRLPPSRVLLLAVALVGVFRAGQTCHRPATCGRSAHRLRRFLASSGPAIVLTGLPQAALTFLSGTLLRPVLLLALEDALEYGRELFLVFLSQVRCQAPGHRDGVTAHDHTNAGAGRATRLAACRAARFGPFFTPVFLLERCGADASTSAGSPGSGDSTGSDTGSPRGERGRHPASTDNSRGGWESAFTAWLHRGATF